MKNTKNMKANNIASNQYFPLDSPNASPNKNKKLNLLVHHKNSIKQKQKQKQKEKLEKFKYKNQNCNSKHKLEAKKQSSPIKNFVKQKKHEHRKSSQSNTMKKIKVKTQYDLWQLTPNPKPKRKSVKSDKLQEKNFSKQIKYKEKKKEIKVQKQKTLKLSPIVKKRIRLTAQQNKNRNKSEYKRRHTNHSEQQRQYTLNSNAKTPQKTINQKQNKYDAQKYGLSFSGDLKDRKKTNSAFTERILKLNNQIKYYKDMHSKSQKALQKMQKIHNRERNSYKDQRKQYLQQINQLIQQSHQSKSNLGHIFTYKQFQYQNMIPDSIILEAFDETQSHHKIQGLKHWQLKKKGEKIIQYFGNLIDKQNEVKQIQNLESLSIVSKCQNQ